MHVGLFSRLNSQQYFNKIKNVTRCSDSGTPKSREARKGYDHTNQLSTVEPPNRGHFGNAAFVLSSEVVLFSEVV